MDNADIVLADDVELIKQLLEDFSGYVFADDLHARMKKRGISKGGLASRVGVSRPMVEKWLLKGAKPHGKERFKELGMALGMDERELNFFLNANRYPRLYAKNPLDMACRVIIAKSAGAKDIVSKYRDLLKSFNLGEHSLTDNPAEISTAALSLGLRNLESTGDFKNWLEENYKNFRAADKIYIPHPELIHFILLYIDGQSLNNMFITGRLPMSVRNLLQPLLADKSVAVKNLRAKLIVFGLYENMNEDEIDIMLETVKLPLFSEPLTRVDQALLTALRCAHERYPYYEQANAEKVLRNLKPENGAELRAFYETQKKRASECVEYYDNEGNKSETDFLFEERYTDYSDKGVLDYISDMLTVLTDGGVFTESETDEYISKMKTYQEE